MIRRRPTTIFSLAFLDCICCGFGAVILLFVLSVDKQDKDTQEMRDQLRQVAAAQLAKLAALNERKGDLDTGHNDAARLLLEAQRTEENMKGLLDDLAEKLQQEKQGQKALIVDVDELKKDIAARQKKPDMLLNEHITPTPIGLPATSTHIAFIIDTSGSMRDPTTESPRACGRWCCGNLIRSSIPIRRSRGSSFSTPTGVSSSAGARTTNGCPTRPRRAMPSSGR